MKMSLQSRFVTAAVVLCVTFLTVGLLSQAPLEPAGQAPANLPATAAAPQAAYVGSATCRRCHAPIYERWSKTRMANVVTDPKQHPEVVLPDFSKPDPLLTFTLNDVAFVYGTKWKQRYFTKVGDDYFPLPAQWDVTHRLWRPYMVQPNTDWWVPLYPADNMKRPTGPLCDGCHSVNYNVQTKAVAEWNVGCERCHGPGSEHVRRPSPATIVNPASSTTCARTTPAFSVIRKASRWRTRSPDSTTTGRWAFTRARISRTSGSSRNTSSERRRSRIFPTRRVTRTGCRATISCRASCTRTA